MALDPKLATLLAIANGKRKKLVLAADDVAAAIAEAAAAPHGIAVRHGGAEVLGKTTLALAVKPPKRATVTVGIAMCWADRPTPGRVWKGLPGPWQQDFARNADKAYAWAATKSADRVAIKAGGAAAPAPKAAPAGDGAKLLAEILANPADDHARAVYADHLTLAGDPRGELITAQLALAGAKKPSAKAQLTKRIKELLNKHRAAWVRHAMQDAKECELERGFVARVKMTGSVWGAKGARLFDHDPIEELVVSKPNGAGLAAIAGAAHTARLQRLALSSPFWILNDRDIATLRAFLASPTVGAVAHLALIINHDGAGGLPADFWTALPVRPAVIELVWSSAPKLSPAQIKAAKRMFPKATVRVS